MHFSSENLQDPVRLNTLLKALRMTLYTRKDDPLFGDLTSAVPQPKLATPSATPIAPPAQVAAPIAPPVPAAQVAAPPVPAAKVVAPPVPAAKVVAPPVLAADAPQLNFVFVRLLGLLWIASRDEWPELSLLLPNIALFMGDTSESQQSLKPSYLAWPLPGITADQSEAQALKALTGKIQHALQPCDQLLLLGENVNLWLNKCPQAYTGHNHLSLPDTHSLCTNPTAKRKLWLHLSQLLATAKPESADSKAK